MINIFVQFIHWLVKTVMALGSSLSPFPSEAVMIPAGYLAEIGKMNLYLAITFGLIGSLIGALFNYYISYKLGLPFLQKYGKYFLVSEKTLENKIVIDTGNKTELSIGYYARYGEAGDIMPLSDLYNNPFYSSYEIIQVMDSKGKIIFSTVDINKLNNSKLTMNKFATMERIENIDNKKKENSITNIHNSNKR